MPTNGVIAPLQPNLKLSMNKGGKHGATLFTKESIVLFFWDRPPKPEIEDYIIHHLYHACILRRYLPERHVKKGIYL